MKNSNLTFWFGIIPNSCRIHIIKNNNLPQFKVKHNCYRCSVCPLSVIECENWTNEIHDSPSLSNPHEDLLKFTHSSEKFFFCVVTQQGIQLITRFFNCYLASPIPTVDSWQGDSLTNFMLFTLSNRQTCNSNETSSSTVLLSPKG